MRKKLLLSLLLVLVISLAGCTKITKEEVTIDSKLESLFGQPTTTCGSFSCTDYYKCTQDDYIEGKDCVAKAVAYEGVICRYFLEDYNAQYSLGTQFPLIRKEKQDIIYFEYVDELGTFWRLCDDFDDSIIIVFTSEEYLNDYLEASK